MQSTNSLAIISTFLLGVTFLVFSVANGTGLQGSRLDDFRTGVALDVASFILFLIATAAAASYSWVINGLQMRGQLPGHVLYWFLLVTKCFIAIPAFFMGLVTLVVSVIGFVQSILGTTADDGDNLAIVSVSFLTLSSVGVLAMLACASIARFMVEFNTFTRPSE
jgi:hypothetical protein